MQEGSVPQGASNVVANYTPFSFGLSRGYAVNIRKGGIPLCFSPQPCPEQGILRAPSPHRL